MGKEVHKRWHRQRIGRTTSFVVEALTLGDPVGAHEVLGQGSTAATNGRFRPTAGTCEKIHQDRHRRQETFPDHLLRLFGHLYVHVSVLHHGRGTGRARL